MSLPTLFAKDPAKRTTLKRAIKRRAMEKRTKERQAAESGRWQDEQSEDLGRGLKMDSEKILVCIMT
jgi:hypothetical protein